MTKFVPSVFVTYARNGASTKANALGMRPMQKRVFEKRGEQYLLIKSPPASGKSHALMYQIEIKGLAEPRSKEAARICQEDLNEVIAAFVQDKPTLERGLFDEELVPEELTQVRMGKIIKEKYPELDAEDQEAVRQHAIAALNLTQQAKRLVTKSEGDGPPNTALIDGVRKFALDMRELDIDLIDRINPFGEAYAILAKTMSEESLKQVAAAISAKRTSLTPDEAKEMAVRAVQFKKERGRIPALDSQDAWERRMAEGAAAFMRFKAEGRYE